jgi:hypothetical protein
MLFFNRSKSFASNDTCIDINSDTPIKNVIKINRHKSDAIPLDIFFLSNQLLIGINRVAITIPIDSGIRNSFAATITKITKTAMNSFFVIDEPEIVI